MCNDLPQILTIGEAAQYLRISSSSLYKLAQDGRIPCQKVGRHWRFHRDTLLRWIAGQKDIIAITVDGTEAPKATNHLQS
jgi:excisionase family DNA binding protein